MLLTMSCPFSLETHGRACRTICGCRMVHGYLSKEKNVHDPWPPLAYCVPRRCAWRRSFWVWGANGRRAAIHRISFKYSWGANLNSVFSGIHGNGTKRRRRLRRPRSSSSQSLWSCWCCCCRDVMRLRGKYCTKLRYFLFHQLLINNGQDL